MLNTIIIQPPLVQLNTPYPSGAYLLSFFNDLYKKQKIDGKVEWFDLSIELFHKIFCKDGLNFIFNKCYISQKLYILNRLKYFMSPDYKINPQLKDKKTEALAEMVNDIVINTPESEIPNIKAINQKSY